MTRPLTCFKFNKTVRITKILSANLGTVTFGANVYSYSRYLESASCYIYGLNGGV